MTQCWAPVVAQQAGPVTAAIHVSLHIARYSRIVIIRPQLNIKLYCVGIVF